MSQNGFVSFVTKMKPKHSLKSQHQFGDLGTDGAQLEKYKVFSELCATGAEEDSNYVIRILISMSCQNSNT